MPIEQDIINGVSGLGKWVLDIILGALSIVPQILGIFETIGNGISTAMNIPIYSKSIGIILFAIASVVAFILSGSVRGKARSGILLIIILALFAVAVYLFL